MVIELSLSQENPIKGNSGSRESSKKTDATASSITYHTNNTHLPSNMKGNRTVPIPIGPTGSGSVDIPLFLC